MLAAIVSFLAMLAVLGPPRVMSSLFFVPFSGSLVWYGMVRYGDGLLSRALFCLIYVVFVVSGHPAPSLFFLVR